MVMQLKPTFDFQLFQRQAPAESLLKDLTKRFQKTKAFKLTVKTKTIQFANF